MPRPKRNNAACRLSLDMSAEERDRIVRLQSKTGATTMAETIRRAVALGLWVASEQADAAKVIVRRADGSEMEVVLL